jgi:hypothetical protein
VHLVARKAVSRAEAVNRPLDPLLLRFESSELAGLFAQGAEVRRDQRTDGTPSLCRTYPRCSVDLVWD